MQRTVTVIIPVYNEKLVLKYLFNRLKKLENKHTNYVFEFLFVNDGSTDETFEIIKKESKNKKSISYINLSRNYGKEIAMIAGLDHAHGDAVAIIDADLQDPPELITEMLKYWEKGYDDIYARRTSRKGETWLKQITSRYFYYVLQRSTRIPIQQDTGDFRLMSQRFVEAIRQFRESERYTKGIFSWVGFRKKEITYIRDPRIAGATKWNYFKLFNLAIDGLTTFTTAPLRLASIFGTLVSVIAFTYIFIIVIRTLLFGSDLVGYPSMMAVILFLGGVQLISLGIIGEYVGRIFSETKKRPLYFIEEYSSKALK